MKKIITFLVVIIGALVLTACSGTDNVDGEFVVVEKDGKKVKEEVVVKSKYGHVTKDDLYQELLDSPAAQPILEDLITKMILQNKYTVTEEEIDAEIEFFKRQIEADGTNFEELLESQSFTLDHLREQVELELLNEALITDGVKVSDEDIEAFYANMGREVDISHIVVDDEEDAKEIKAKLDAGEDFATLAKAHSTDTSAAKGGDLGFIKFGSSAGYEFDTTAFSLEVGTISDIVKSDWGYHIIQVNDEKELEEDIGTLEDNRQQIKRRLLEEKVDPEEASKRVENIHKDAEVKIFIEQFKDLLKKEEINEEAPAEDEVAE